MSEAASCGAVCRAIIVGTGWRQGIAFCCVLTNSALRPSVRVANTTASLFKKATTSSQFTDVFSKPKEPRELSLVLRSVA